MRRERSKELDQLDEHPIVRRGIEKLEQLRRESYKWLRILSSKLADDIDGSRDDSWIRIFELLLQSMPALVQGRRVVLNDGVQAENGLLSNGWFAVIQHAANVSSEMLSKLWSDNVGQAIESDCDLQWIG